MSDINNYIVQFKQQRLTNLYEVLLSATNPLAIQFIQNKINKLTNQIEQFVYNVSTLLAALLQPAHLSLSPASGKPIQPHVIHI